MKIFILINYGDEYGKRLELSTAGASISAEHEELSRNQAKAYCLQYPELCADGIESLFESARRSHIDIDNFVESVKRKIQGNASQLDVNSWTAKSIRAERIVSGTGTEADAAIVGREASERGLGETAEQLAAAQSAKSQRLEMLLNTIDGRRKRMHAHIETLFSAKHVNGYVEEMKKQSIEELSNG